MNRLKLELPDTTEGWLVVVIGVLVVFLSLTTDTFLTLTNVFDLLNQISLNVILAVGLLVVLIAGGIDISFAVAASVVQYLVAVILIDLGGGNWAAGFLLSALFGFLLGAFNAFLIHYFRIISIVVTIATFNIYFGTLMFFTRGVSIYNLPDWWVDRIVLFEVETASGYAEITLPVVVMVVVAVATWLLIRRTTLGRQLFAMGDNPEGARRIGVNIAGMHFLAYGWLGMCAGLAGLMAAHRAQEVVPNALIGTELDVLAAVVLGGARLGGGRGTVFGALLGVALMTITQNGLNLLGVSPFAFRMIVGAVILVAITLSSGRSRELLGAFSRTRRA